MSVILKWYIKENHSIKNVMLLLEESWCAPVHGVAESDMTE